MKVLRKALLCLLIIVLPVFAPIAWAQDETPTAVTIQNRTGDLPFSQSVGTGVEHVDIGSGNLIVDVPIISLSGRHMPFSYGLRYNALFWTVATRTQANGQQLHFWNIERRPYVGGIDQGLGFTPTQAQLSWGISTENCTNVNGTPPDVKNTASGYIYTDAGGGKHALPIVQNSATSVDGGCFDGQDGTGFFQGFAPAEGILAVAPDIYSTPAVYLPDGTQVAWPTDNSILNPPATPDGWYPINLAQYLDANGNTKCEDPAHVACNPSADTLGRNPLTIVNGTNQVLYQVSDSDGVQRTYTVNLGTINVQTNFGIAGVSEHSQTRIVVTSILLPNGRPYSFQYENGSYGGLTSITLPTGGTISYTWATLSPSGNPYLTHRYIASRTVTVGSQISAWTFTKTCVDSGCFTVNTDVGDPSGNHTLYQHSEGKIVSAKVYSGPVGGTLLRQYDVAYNTLTADPNALPTRITTTLENGVQTKVEYDYDTTGGVPGNVSEIREYGYGSGAPGALLRRTHKAYGLNSNPSYLAANIVGKVTEETVYDSAAATCQGAARPCADTQYEYDNYLTGDNPLQSTSSSAAAQHDYSGHGSSFTLRGNLTRVKHWRNTDGAWLTTTYSYDDLGNIRAIKDPLGHSTTYDYTDSFANLNCLAPAGMNGQAWVSTVTNALNQQVKVVRFPCTGLVQSHRDQNDINAGRAGTTYTYDPMGRQLTKDLADGGHTSFSYNDVPPVSVTTTTKITSALNLISTAVMDGLGRTQQAQLNSDPAGTDYTDTTYDLMGRVATVSNPYRSNGDSTYGITQSQYDPLGRPVQVTKQDGSISTVSYTANCTTATDEAGKQRKSCSDALGRLTNVWEDPSGLNYETDYQYDVQGNLLRVDQKGSAPGDSSQWRTRLFTYNSLSQLLTANNPESGAMSYTYDNDGNVSTQTDARGIVTTFGYDSLHRITSKSHSDGTFGAGYTYDQTGVWGVTETNTLGRLVLAYDGHLAATLFGYDALGRVTTQWDCPPSTFGIGCPTVQASYDLAGDLTRLVYPNGEVLNYAVDSAGRTLSAVEGSGSPSFVSGATYGPDGGLTGYLNGSGGPASITSSFSYDKRLQPVTMAAAMPNQTIFSIGYDFHAGNGTAGSGTDNGNVYGIYNYRDRTRDQSFTYDPLNRLLTAQNAGTDCSAATVNGKTEYWGNSYTYDPWGNLTGKTVTKCSAENMSVVGLANNRLSGYSYDLTGNMTNDGAGHALTFDAENRISQVNSGAVRYTYDPTVGRVRKDVTGQPSTEYFYFGGEVMAEKNVSTGAWTNYVFFDGERVARREFPAGSVFYYFSDHLKTASVITDASGTIKAESDYYPWGGELQFVNNDANDYKFTGKKRDIETGLDYFGARYYSNGMGRWVSADWSATPVPVPYADFGDPQTLNLYTYVQGIPTTMVDLDGHGCPPVCPAVPPTAPNPTSEEVDTALKSIQRATAAAEEGASGVSLSAILTGIAIVAVPAMVWPDALPGGKVGQSNADEMAERNRLEAENALKLGQARGADEDQSQSDIAKDRQRTNGSHAQGEDFSRAAKREIDARDGNKCQGCRRDVKSVQNKKGIPTPADQRQRHHIIPKSAGGKGTPDNAKTLCPACHKEEHRKMREQK